ncbi:CHAT domain-containing protein [Kitasatospora sp. NPDC048365]|uniref:CHAT domain-containing protein n=1 Tax=Kitasatospora sp. NPDC048365 TaxID=3364050 RepID=UPI00371D9A81
MDAATVKISDLLDRPPIPANPGPAAGPDTPAQPPADTVPTRSLTVTVVWGDLVEQPADVHLTGHYQDVAPAAAELALDHAISSGPRNVITEHTRHGWIDAALGEVTYFPARSGTVRSAAVIGMGRLGTFTERRSVQLYESLLSELLGLGHVRTAATVLVGSGAGNLQVPQVARAMIGGFGAALRGAVGARAGAPDGAPVALTDVYVVEIDRLRAAQLLRALAEEARRVPAVHVTTALASAPGGGLSRSSAAVYAVTGLTRLARAAATAPATAADAPAGGNSDGAALAGVLAALDPEVREPIRRQLVRLAELDVTDLALSVRPSTDLYSGSMPVRISVLSGDGGFRWAALTERATVPERQVPVDADLLRQLVARLTGPTLDDAATLPDLLSRLVVPLDFQRLISDEASLELELDRETAAVPWEFLTDLQEGSSEPRAPLAVRTPLARRLRTGYARVATDSRAGEPLRVLVIGDPGDPEKGMQLRGAREEAKAVHEVLQQLGVQSRLFIGAANALREPGAEPATRLDVLRTLLRGEYQIVHYCGHGTFDDSGTVRRSGWVFADGLLSAQELAQLDRPPRMVVANACWSARLAGGAAAPGATGADPVAAERQATLIPSLADEFLRAGVTHYIGAGWQVPDQQGIGFARTFYTELLAPLIGRAPGGVGDAVKAAREQMFKTRDLHRSATDPGTPEPLGWSAWAAYQHYGDPADEFGSATLRESPR